MHRTADVAESVLDPRGTGFRLDVRVEDDGFFLVDEERPLRPTPVDRNDVEVWKPDWAAMAIQLGDHLGFEPCKVEGDGQTRRIGVYRQNGIAPKPVHLHVPKPFSRGVPGDLLRLSDCVLVMTSARMVTDEVVAIAGQRRISIQTPERDAALPPLRNQLQMHAKGAPVPIMNPERNWKWEKLVVEADADRLTASYGRQRGTFRFVPDNKKGTARHAEILLQMTKGGWLLGQEKSRETDRKALRRLSLLLKAIIPIEGEPFVVVDQTARAVFQIRYAGDGDVR